MKQAVLTMVQPDDWHVHLREGALLKHVLADTARVMARAIVMPNLSQPVCTLAQVRNYRQQIMSVLTELGSDFLGAHFEPLMTWYLNDRISLTELKQAKQSQEVIAAKLYPRGVTTHSQHGVSDIRCLYPIFELMQKEGIILLVHAEVNDPDVDIFDREAVFLDRILRHVVVDFPALKIVVEHVSTQDAVDFVRDSGDNIAATVTAHHLVLNRNALLSGGLHPHHYCLPILKAERHRLALCQAVTSGSKKFFLGTDSAPHTRQAKESACGCAGVFSAPVALPLYAAVFEHYHALDKLEAFSSFHGADFYGLPRNKKTICLTKNPWSVPEQHPSLSQISQDLVVFWAGKTLDWQVAT